ncbi:hypothetical protein [Hymenobacter coccineus]|uniref:Uncharacterized protein n=1 Tax=Hymenobacter coccineus TaxID=1908235 RepID=A0A1G1THH7_9BACT|nr:hypothetical protein [Hymenobacter coccineus]OGX90318.1 hypothetical protein BEN49_07100 [Hymenobacter coccineus]
MLRIILVLLCCLLGLVDAPEATAAASAPTADHHPRYKAYKYRGQARKRNARMGFFARRRARRQAKRAQQPKHRGVIKVGDLEGTMPK